MRDAASNKDERTLMLTSRSFFGFVRPLCLHFPCDQGFGKVRFGFSFLAEGSQDRNCGSRCAGAPGTRALAKFGAAAHRAGDRPRDQQATGRKLRRPAPPRPKLKPSRAADRSQPAPKGRDPRVPRANVARRVIDGAALTPAGSGNRRNDVRRASLLT